MDWSLGNYWYLLLLLVIPFIGVILIAFVKWRNARKSLFAEQRFQDELFEKTNKFSKIFPVLYLLAFTFLIFSIVDLLGGNEQVKSQQKMNNVIFLLDVSNSMNAEDIQPNRMTMAKNVMVNSLKGFTNDRVGIVVFAGEARSIMPLTTDFTAAETYISGIETSIVQIQGTDFLKAMQEVVKKFKNVPKGARQIVLISDGEDNEGNDKAALNLAKKEGIRITSVGIGTEEGAPVPEYVYGQLMGYKVYMTTGQTVVSRRQTNALSYLASGTGGNYIDGNSLEDASKKIVSSLNEKGGVTNVMIDSQNAVHYYQYFLAVSLLLFLMIYLLNPKRDFNI
ncbi:Mg-chelatase subunit ChlD [Chryseobacterium taklimakanense]|uniref:Mg-chelatase subunit ChlD n=1 Tax=Chryseobacterium taklimakanense TaxID=536441 RepID=A0A239X3F7_9FLAO|nr:VWA domain-containing protein [Chryseobacterium taklimakanense]SNV41227.1 Mg-chelatase subunit ChlD [Chryseobacterium taklimakanense]